MIDLTLTPCYQDSDIGEIKKYFSSLFNLTCRLFTGQGESKLISDLRHELLVVEDRSAGWCPDIQISQLLRTNMQSGVVVRVGIELYGLSEITEICVSPSQNTNKRDPSGLHSSSNGSSQSEVSDLYINS